MPDPDNEAEPVLRFVDDDAQPDTELRFVDDVEPDTDSEVDIRPRTISDVENISGTPTAILSRDRIETMIEEPLVEAVRRLFDRNIRTIASTANKKDITMGGRAALALDLRNLSDENRRIAEEIAAEEEARPAAERRFILSESGGDTGIYYPLTPDTTIDEIEEATAAIADRFVTQSFAWGGRSVSLVIKIFSLNPKEFKTPEDLEVAGFGFVSDDGLIYPKEELRDKQNAWLDSVGYQSEQDLRITDDGESDVLRLVDSDDQSVLKLGGGKPTEETLHLRKAVPGIRITEDAQPAVSKGLRIID